MEVIPLSRNILKLAKEGRWFCRKDSLMPHEVFQPRGATLLGKWTHLEGEDVPCKGNCASQRPERDGRRHIVEDGRTHGHRPPAGKSG